MTPTQPIPQGNYVPARRHGDLIFTSGITPRREGVLIQTGTVARDAALEEFRDSVVLAVGNALAAAMALLNEGERIFAILSMNVFIAAEAGFTTHSKLADFASEHLYEKFGADGIGARAALGVATLPGNAPVEIQLVCATG